MLSVHFRLPDNISMKLNFDCHYILQILEGNRPVVSSLKSKLAWFIGLTGKILPAGPYVFKSNVDCLN